MDLYLVLRGFIGYMLSLSYESIAGNWHAKKIKAWIFVVLCLGVGAWGAILDGTLQFTKLSWGDPSLILTSISNLLEWAGIILFAGIASFKFFIYKKQ